MQFLFNGEGKKHYVHHAQNTSCHRPVATRMEKRPCLLSPLDIKILWATCAHMRLSKPACNQMVLSKKQGENYHGRNIRAFWMQSRSLSFFTVAAPEKINFDTELPLYKQITILSNNLICAKPTENSLKNQ